MSIALTVAWAGQKLKKMIMLRNSKAIKLTHIPRSPYIRQGPQLSSNPGVFVSSYSEVEACLISPEIRRQNKSAQAMKYDEQSPATEIEFMLVNVVDENRTSIESKMETRAVKRTAATGIDVLGWTFKIRQSVWMTLNLRSERLASRLGSP